MSRSRMICLLLCSLFIPLGSLSGHATIVIRADIRLHGSTIPDNPIAFSPNGRYVFEQWFCSFDNTPLTNFLDVNDIKTGKRSNAHGSAGAFTAKNELFCCPDSLYDYDEIYLLNPATGKQRALFRKTKHRSPFLWKGLSAPDVNMHTGIIACVGYTGTGLINPQTGAVLLIGDGVSPHWSPDGKKLAFKTDRNITVCDATGRNGKKLVGGDIVGWLQTNRPQLLIKRYQKDSEGLCRLDVKTGQCRQLANFKYSQHPDIDIYTDFDLSPSGHYVTVSDISGITFIDTRNSKQQYIKPKHWLKKGKEHNQWVIWGTTDNTLYYRTIEAEGRWRKLKLNVSPI